MQKYLQLKIYILINLNIIKNIKFIYEKIKNFKFFTRFTEEIFQNQEFEGLIEVNYLKNNDYEIKII